MLSLSFTSLLSLSLLISYFNSSFPLSSHGNYHLKNINWLWSSSVFLFLSFSPTFSNLWFPFSFFLFLKKKQILSSASRYLSSLVGLLTQAFQAFSDSLAHRSWYSKIFCQSLLFLLYLLLEKPKDAVSLQAIIYPKGLQYVLLLLPSTSTSCTSYNSTNFKSIAPLHVGPLLVSKIFPLRLWHHILFFIIGIKYGIKQLTFLYLCWTVYLMQICHYTESQYKINAPHI